MLFELIFVPRLVRGPHMNHLPLLLPRSLLRLFLSAIADPCRRNVLYSVLPLKIPYFPSSGPPMICSTRYFSMFFAPLALFLQPFFGHTLVCPYFVCIPTHIAVVIDTPAMALTLNYFEIRSGLFSKHCYAFRFSRRCVILCSTLASLRDTLFCCFTRSLAACLACLSPCL